MDLSKKEIKALVLDIRKPMAGVNEILKDANGKVRNEGQEVSYVTLGFSFILMNDLVFI